MSLKVCEIFTSVQGEGPSAGQASTFLRLAGCNLHCTWCDSKYSWGEGKPLAYSTIKRKLQKSPVRRLVITGGEPLAQQYEVSDFLFSLPIKNGFFVECETNGSLFPEGMLRYQVNSWIVSPKLESSGNPESFNPSWINIAIRNWELNLSKVYFKFVVGNQKELDEVLVFVKEHNIPDVIPIYLMPKGISVNEQQTSLKLIMNFVKDNPRFRVSPRLHIVAFGNQRGV